jgi:nicotinamidase-related amidase
MRLEETILVIVDMQDRLLKVIPNRDKLIQNIVLLAEYYRLTNTPIIVTKQIKLGDIIDELKKYSSRVIEKKYFSCMKEEAFRKELEKYNRRTIVLTGIETHICILQTALDMLREGYKVIIPNDAVASQIESDHIYALKYLREKGAVIIPVESLIYMSMESPDHRNFKEILKYVKERRKKLSSP